MESLSGEAKLTHHEKLWHDTTEELRKDDPRLLDDLEKVVGKPQIKCY